MQALTTQVLDADVSEAELEVQSSLYAFQKDLVGREDTLEHCTGLHNIDLIFGSSDQRNEFCVFFLHALIVLGHDGAKRDGGDGGPGQLDGGRLHPGQGGKSGWVFAENVLKNSNIKV